MPNTTKGRFTPEELKLIHRAGNRVWQELGYDFLSAMAEEGQSTVKRSWVLEVVLDAGRTYEVLSKLDLDLAKRFDQLDYETMVKVMKPAFPYAVYGM